MHGIVGGSRSLDLIAVYLFELLLVLSSLTCHAYVTCLICLACALNLSYLLHNLCRGLAVAMVLSFTYILLLRCLAGPIIGLGILLAFLLIIASK